MIIKYSQTFKSNLTLILNYIKKDSLTRALKFKNKIKQELENLNTFPLKHRKSIYYNSQNIRDYIIKGYTITYKINKDEIIILNIKKYRI